jgi:hypothetical protein
MTGVRRAWLLVAAAAGCGGPAHFGCDEDAQCQQGAAAGVCEVSGYCSFPDPACDSGRRYGHLAGGGLAGLCVLDEGSSSGAPAPSTSASISATADGSSSGDPLPVATEGESASTSSGAAATSTAEGSTSTDAGGESSTGEPNVPVDGLVVWYGFEDLGVVPGTADLSGNGRDATCVLPSCPAAVAGVVGMAAQFDGLSTLLELADEPALRFQGDYSVSLWARMDGNIEDYAVLFGKSHGDSGDNSYEIYYAADSDALIFNQDTTTPIGNVVLVAPMAGVWLHVVGVNEAGEMRLYVDGVEVGVDPNTPVPLYDDSPMTVGGDYTGPLADLLWPGAIDEVRVYDRALDGTEVDQLFAEGTP